MRPTVCRAIRLAAVPTKSPGGVAAGSIDFDTTVTGRATVYSPEYRNNQNVAEIEMTISSLAEVGGRTWLSTAHPLTVLVARS